MVLTLAYNLRSKSSPGTRPQLGMIILKNIELLLNLLDPTDSNVTSSFETIGDFQRMDTLIQKFLGLLKDGTGKNDDTSRSISNLIVLRGRKFRQEPRCLVMNL